MDTENIRFLGKELSPNKTETAGWVLKLILYWVTYLSG